MKISALFLICLFAGGCSQMSYFSNTSDTENRDPVIKPILDTKEIADLNKEENEIATAIIVSILNSKAFVLTKLREHNSEVKYNIFLGINEKNPSKDLLEFNSKTGIRVFAAQEGILRDEFVYHSNPKIIPVFFSMSEIEIQIDKASAKVLEYQGPIDAIFEEVILLKDGEEWVIQSWEEIW